MTTTEGERAPINIEEEMRGSYLAYAMSVIIGRALPDVRDGLKPVHRRVLYAMYEQRNLFNSAYKKSARIVGDVIGKYHPHGDQAAYDTMVRMAQDFSLRYPLVDGQGNFGSIDGDSAAAMRYTEVRMTRLAGELLSDIEKETVDWQENYDGSEKEPTVMPAGFPNLLVNGSGGIAVGMATNMPPHNLTEVVEATIACIENPEITTPELMEIVPGPDFPTAGYIYGRQGIVQAYETGRGIIKMRAKTDIELDKKGDEWAIVVTELPYQVNKARLLERIAGLVRDKKIEGIRDLRDESDRRGMRMVIELKKGAMGQIVLNKLFAMTAMQSTFGIINLAIVNGQPKVLTLKELLVHFVNHRRDVVTRRCRYELRKAQERAHVLEGYLIALDNIDEVVAIIKASPTPQAAREGLSSRFSLSDIQAQSILDMRLQRLTGLEVDKIKEEYAEIQKTIERLKAILASDTLLMDVIVGELRAIQERYGDERRTEIVDASSEIGMEDLIADEDMVVTITATGYIKRTPLADYRTQRRGGRGRTGMSTKTEDVVTDVFVASAHTLLLIFTDRGQVYPIKVWELPRAGINATGKAIVNLIPLQQGETIKSVVPVGSLDRQDLYLLFATRRGLVKRTRLDQYKNVRNSGIRAIVLMEGDDLIGVRLAGEGSRVMMVTARGQSIVFHLEDARATGRATRGVRGIRLRGEDVVVAMDVLDEHEQLEETEELAPVEEGAAGADEAAEAEAVAEELVEEAPEEDEDDSATEEVDEDEGAPVPTVLLITENGYGKRTPLHRFRLQRRGGLGLRALPYVERNGELVDMARVKKDQDLLVVTDGGTIIRLRVDSVNVYSRQAKGVKVINPSKGEKVVSANPVAGADDSEDEILLDEEGNPIEVIAEDAEGAEALAVDEGAEAVASEDATDADDDAVDAGEDA
ncbi:MAG: DNA gyrase subunit A [Deltaproteobacteria bacterium]|nr:DNA gyrase subunit A [Deltaproteobacteria bacterium]